MSANTKIQWCHHTHNPWRGCRKVADECKNCYIVTTVPFRTTGQKHGSVRVRAGEATLREPHAWNRAAEKAGERRRVFCLSLGDWLDDENVPIKWLAELLETICRTPWLDWLLLTKRPQNWWERVTAASSYMSRRDNVNPQSFPMWGAALVHGWVVERIPLKNVWIGVSAGANQAAALHIPAKIHFLSCEPMLRPLDTTLAHLFEWIIFGGESGTDSRVCMVDWIRDGVRFCRINGIKCFVKQLGTKHCNLPDFPLELRDKKGGDMAEWPEDLRVREFPNSG